MRFFHKKDILFGLIVSSILVGAVNLYQYLKLVTLPVYRGDETSGFPFPVYEFYISFQIGSWLLNGVFANVLFAIVMGIAIGLVFSVLNCFKKFGLK